MSIHDIQYTTDASGNSPYNGQVVWTGGIVTGVNYSGQPIRYFIADRSGGLWSGILVNDNQSRSLNIGDSVHFQAEVQESSSQTRLRNLVAGTFTTIASSGVVPPVVVATGSVVEPTEGVLVELQNVTVTAVGSNQFTVNDGSGPVTVGEGWSYTYDPLVNDQLTYIRGVISSSGATFTVNPRDDTDFGFVGNRPPLISNVQNSPESPTELQADSIRAMIIDETGVARASVFYRFGTAGEFLERPMYDDGLHGDGQARDGLWMGVIPASPEPRVTCYYYIFATDSQDASGTSPANAPTSTYSYIVKSSVLEIFDLQYTGDPTGGSSSYDGRTVTVTGIVTGTEYGSYRDGFFISDPGDGRLWSGIEVYNPSSTPALGDSIRITGAITEYNGLTEFDDGAAVTVLGKGTIPDPIDLSIGMMDDSAEAYEGTFAKIGACYVTSTASWLQYKQFEIRSHQGEDGTIVANFALDYEPAVGDSFLWIQGCVTYNSNPKWMVAPRSDSDLGYIDRRPPRVTGTAAVSDTAINITLNEWLKESSASNTANYTIIDQHTFDTLHVLNAYRFRTGKTIQLNTLELLVGSYGMTIRGVQDTSGNVMPDTTVYFGAFEPGEYTTIAQVYADTSLNGIPITLRGIVTFVQDVTTTSGSRRISAFIQDESGRGLNLSQTGAAATFPGIQRGNLITITGIASTYESNLQMGSFTASSVTVLAENRPLPAPVIVRTGDVRTQRSLIHTEWPGNYGSGTWVQTAGTIYRVDENVGGGTNIAIDDGTGNCGVRIWDSMNLDSVYLGSRWYRLRDLVGIYCQVSGPASMYNNDFQMLAGYAEDFVLPQTGGVTEEFSLSVPNRPFAPDLGQKLRIRYSAPSLAEIRLRVFDLRGREVASLVNNRAGGSNVLDWDGRNDLRELLPIGTYILHLEAVENGNTRTTTKPIVIGTKL